MKKTLLLNYLAAATSRNLRKNTTRFNGLLALFVIVMGMGVSWGQTIIVGWDGSSATATSGTVGNTSVRQFTAIGGPTVSVNSSSCTKSFSATGWDAGNGAKYWQAASINTVGFTTLKLTSTSRSSGTGPRDFKVQYNIGAGWVDASLTYAITSTNCVVSVNDASLPAACENQSSLSIRWIMTSNTGSAGTLAATGTSQLTAISLTGNASTPEINIKQSTTSYASGSTYAFGNQIATTSSSATTFTIENTGSATLNLSGSPKVAISGNTSEFTVDQTSTASTVLASGATSFTVTFNPTSTGAKSAAISIANDDATGSENPYIINLTGTGTINSSSASDIITQSGYSYTSNIDYANKQTASSLTIANSVGVNGLTLRDGGATTDADALGTTLTDVTFSTGGSTAIRTAALFDGTNKIAEVAVNGATSIVFTGLSLSATDGGTKDFELRVTYQSSVTDNQQIIYTISSAIASATNSGFAAANAGAAASSNTSDINRLEVTASVLAFVAQPATTLVSASMTNVTVSANDALANRDLDFTSSVRITSTGTLTGTPVDVIASSGLATFNSLTHTTIGSSLTLNAERSTGLDWDVTSNTFDIVVQAPGLLLLEDNFNSTSGQLTNNSWIQIGSTATYPISTGNDNGLNYSNYGSTNIGNSAILTSSGQDIYKTFTPQIPGTGSSTIYYSALINITNIQSTGDYFLSLGESSTFTGSATYRSRIFAKTGSTSGKILFGTSTSNGTVNYSNTEYDINTPILLVIKYLFTTSTSTSSLFINPSLYAEPNSASVSDATASSVTTGLDAIVLRQGTAAYAPSLVIDGIRVATNWGAVTGNTQYSDNNTIAAGNYNSITTYAGSSPSVSGNVNVYGQISILGGTLTTNNTLTLKSNANGTAQVAAIGTGGTITGNVTVERYIPSGKRAFRLLTPSVTTSGTIKNNWQINGANTVGKGTHITGSTTGANGFDATASGNPSMYTYDNNITSGSGWQAIPNTDVLTLAAGTGYRTLVRGDRNVDISIASADNMNVATTLSATGTLKMGDVVFNSTNSNPLLNTTTNTTTNGYSLIGNPYACPVDWHTVTKSNVADTYYSWDPNMGDNISRGRYVAYTASSSSNDVQGSAVNRYIQPGQAIFVKTSGASPVLTFKETDKASGFTNVFRTNASNSRLSLSLYNPSEVAFAAPIDGTTAVFGSDFSSEIGYGDAEKLFSAGENLAWSRDAKFLAIDALAPAVATDELKLKTIRFAANTSYTFKINASNFDNSLSAFLVDQYLNTQTAIDLTAPNFVNFATTADAASYGADRFKVVFSASSTLNNDQWDAKSLRIYPNPVVDNQFTIGVSSSITDKVTITLYNIIGQSVYQVSATPINNTIQVQPNVELKAGVYMVEMTHNGQTNTQKIIVK